MSTHQVRRARFRVRSPQVPDMQQRQAWQALFEDRYLDLFDRALATWLQQHPQLQEQSLRIDRLQLELGPLRSAMDDDTLLLSLQRQLDDQLPHSTAFSAADWQLHCHLHFLRTGTWPAGSQTANARDMELWWQQHDLRPMFLRQLARELAHEALWLRLYLQHSADFVHWLSHDRKPRRADTASPEAALLAILQLWLALGEPGAAAPTSRTLAALRAGCARQMDVHNREINDLQLLRHFLREQTTRCSAIALDKSPANAPGQESGPQPDAPLTTESDRIPFVDSGISVEQAGLVVLHPYLGTLFTCMGLLQDNHFIDAQARQRAIFALNFAATGELTADEGDLTLHKFLVNWPVSQPLPWTVPLPDAQLALIEELLHAVIGHWTVLKNTSIDGLRETFLQRHGLLSVREDACELFVEARTVDVLLDRLPWSLSMVKLPWQSIPLHVSWRR